jgi:hypothetical protein
LPDVAVLLKNGHASLGRHQPDETDLAHGNWQGLAIDLETGWELAEACAPSVWGTGALPQVGRDLLLIDTGHKAAQFTTHRRWATRGVAEEQRWEPAVELLDRAIVLGTALRNEDRLDSQAAREADHTTEGIRTRTKTTELAAVIKRDLLRQAERPPRAHQASQDAVQLAIVGERQVDGEIKGVMEDEKIVTRGVSLEGP